VSVNFEQMIGCIGPCPHLIGSNDVGMIEGTERGKLAPGCLKQFRVTDHLGNVFPGVVDVMRNTVCVETPPRTEVTQNRELAELSALGKGMGSGGRQPLSGKLLR
jgi:hypothetical protein